MKPGNPDVIGEWSKWRATDGPCPAYCCGGPNDGEHRRVPGLRPRRWRRSAGLRAYAWIPRQSHFPTDVVEFTPDGPC
jgi:hypothetical protein